MGAAAKHPTESSKITSMWKGSDGDEEKGVNEPEINVHLGGPMK